MHVAFEDGAVIVRDTTAREGTELVAGRTSVASRTVPTSGEEWAWIVAPAPVSRAQEVSRRGADIAEWRAMTVPLRAETTEAAYCGGYDFAATRVMFCARARFQRDAAGRVTQFVYYEFGARLGVAARTDAAIALDSSASCAGESAISAP